MDKLELAAAMAQRLQREFPNSGFVDDALLQLAEVRPHQRRADSGHRSLLATGGDAGEPAPWRGAVRDCRMLRVDGQGDEGPGASQLYDRAFQEYKKLFEQFPESGRIGEAVAKMAN